MKYKNILEAEAHFEALRQDINDRLNEGFKPSRNMTAFLQGWGAVQTHFAKFIHSGKEDTI